MKASELITDEEILTAIKKSGFTGRTFEECRLCLLELIVKAGAGYYNSSTKESFLSRFGLLKLNRTANKKGRKFIMSMIYASSNNRAYSYGLMNKYRK